MFAPLALLWLALGRVRWRHRGLVAVIVTLGGSAVLLGRHALTAQREQRFLPPTHGLYQVLLLIALAVAVAQLLRRQDVKPMALLLAMASVAWASGISWGYAYPVLFALPGLLGVVYFLSVINGQHVQQSLYAALAVCAALSFGIMNRYPYMERPVEELTYDLGELFPRMQHIRTHRASYEKHARMKALHAQYGDNLIVLPAMPLAHYMLGIRSPVQVDWPLDGEIGFERGAAAIVERLQERATVVLVEKARKSDAFLPPGIYKCSVLERVLATWRKLEEDAHFEVLAPPRTQAISASRTPSAY
jgi:hypothetical protein